jgi:hypothetical protein
VRPAKVLEPHQVQAGQTAGRQLLLTPTIILNTMNENIPTDLPQRPELPDHLSTDERSAHHVAAIFEHDIGIRFNGNERSDVTEYCISEGWIKVPVGKKMDRKGNPLTIKLKGKVEAYYK